MQQLSIPFYQVRIEIEHNSQSVLFPLYHPSYASIGETSEFVARHFAQALTHHKIKAGEYQEILFESTAAKLTAASLTLSFKASKEGLWGAYPAFDLSLSYYWAEQGKQYWAVVPALGIEVLVEDLDVLEARLEEVIRQTFARERRLSFAQNLIALLWYQDVALIEETVTLDVPSLAELRRLQKNHASGEDARWLNKVGHVLGQREVAHYGMKEARQQLKRALQGKFNRNILLVGPSGVGKTVLVEALAWILRETHTIWSTQASILIKELTGETGWQANLALLCRELRDETDTFLYVRNLLSLFEVGQYEGNSVSIAEFLRDYLSRGELNLISECTEEGYAQIEARAPNYLSNFQVIRLQEPKSAKELMYIVDAKVRFLAAEQALTIEPEAIRECIRLHRRYMPYSGFPGKPIRFLESILLSRVDTTQAEKHVELDRATVIQAFCEETGMPNFMVDPDIPLDLVYVRRFFDARIFGQDKAMYSLTDLMVSVKTAMLRQEKPIASLLFVGPTGVGKTEMSKVLAEFMFGERSRMLRFDMSEYSSAYAVSRLTGSDYFSEGTLTSAVRRAPFSVLLFDELEKAHASFYDLLLQILGEGRLSDRKGRFVNFCSTIIIMTSNIGAEAIQKQQIGWSETQKQGDISAQFEQAVQQHFRPELFNRIDQILTFEPLSELVITFVVERELKALLQREGLRHRNIDLSIKPSVPSFLAHHGFSPQYGARELQRVIRTHLLTPLATQLNEHSYDDKLVVEIQASSPTATALDIHIEADPLKIELLIERLQCDQYAEYASELRRRFHQMTEGSIYWRFISTLEELQAAQKSDSAFWKQAQDIQRYTEGLQLKADLQAAKEKIEALEEEMALVSMQLRPYRAKIHDAIDAWHEQFVSQMVHLNMQVNPNERKTYLAVFAEKDPEFILDVYENLFDKEGYTYRKYALWQSPAVYNEQLYGLNPAVAEAAWRGAINWPEDIILAPWGIEKEAEAPHPEAIWCGTVFEVKGALPGLYLAREVGTHERLEQQQPPHIYVVKQADMDIYHQTTKDWPEEIRILHSLLLPNNIHRKAFFKKQPAAFRKYDEQLFQDSRYSIQVDKSADEHWLDILAQRMNTSFRQALERKITS